MKILEAQILHESKLLNQILDKIEYDAKEDIITTNDDSGDNLRRLVGVVKSVRQVRLTLLTMLESAINEQDETIA